MKFHHFPPLEKLLANRGKINYYYPPPCEKSFRRPWMHVLMKLLEQEEEFRLYVQISVAWKC